MRSRLLKAAISSLFGAFWWFGDHLYGDRIFKWFLPMIPDWLANPPIVDGLKLLISYGPLVGFLCLALYFFLASKREPKRTDDKIFPATVTQSEADDRKRNLLEMAKSFVSKTVNKSSDYDYFRHELEKQLFFFDLKPYLTENFMRAMHGRLIVVGPGGSNVPGIAWSFLSEIERLEKEWNFR